MIGLIPMFSLGIESLAAVCWVRGQGSAWRHRGQVNMLTSPVGHVGKREWVALTSDGLPDA
jgi:hypothetical protein